MSFDLTLRIGVSERDYFNKFGQNAMEVKNRIMNETLQKDNACCQGCNYKPLRADIATKILSPHLVEWDPNDINKAVFVSLCKACHTTQHIDKAISEGWVSIVNSSFSQKNLIEMCRVNSAHSHLKSGEIRMLKMTPEEYLDQLKNNTLPLHSRVKVIFTSKFEWGDMA